MSINRKWLIGGLALAMVGAAGAGAIARGGHHGWGGHHGGKHGWHSKRGMNPTRLICSRKSAERIDYMLVGLKHKVDITDEQMPAYEDFANTVRSAANTARESCPPKPDWKKRKRDAQAEGEQGEDKPRLKPSPIERLANMEKMLSATLTAIQTVKPKAEALYASLSEEQQTKLRKVHHKHRWGKRDRGGKKHWKKRGDRDHDRRGSGSDTPSSDAPADSEN